MNRKSEEIRSLLSEHPKTSLGFFPTPFHKLEQLSGALGVNLYMKRDDFTGVSLFGGNKIRKLEYLLGEALSKGCDYVFTYGATQSNHAMQTVTACKRLGLTPVLYLVAIVEPDKDDVRSNLLLDKILGAEIHIVSLLPGEALEEAEERSFRMAKEHRKRLEAEGHKCFDIPMGGADPRGTLGFIEGYTELKEQLEVKNLKADYIFHATGTGGTMAGLIAGRKLFGDDTKIISINVSKKDASYLYKSAELANKSLKLLGVLEEVEALKDFYMDTGYYLPGYEIPSETASKAIRLLAAKEGIFADPVYTGKAFDGMLDYIWSGRVPQGSTVVFWHTGGATALFAEREILGGLAE